MPRWTRPPTDWSEVPLILDSAYVAKLLAISLDKVRDMMAKGEIPARKAGREWRITKDRFKVWMEGGKTC